jgi:hypothetical protein
MLPLARLPPEVKALKAPSAASPASLVHTAIEKHLKNVLGASAAEGVAPAPAPRWPAVVVRAVLIIDLFLLRVAQCVKGTADGFEGSLRI